MKNITAEMKVYQLARQIGRLLPKWTGANDAVLEVRGSGSTHLSFDNDFDLHHVDDYNNPAGHMHIHLHLIFGKEELPRFERWMRRMKLRGLEWTKKSRIVSMGVIAASLMDKPTPKNAAPGWPSYMMIVEVPKELEESAIEWRFSRRFYSQATMYVGRRNRTESGSFDDKNYSVSLLGQRRSFQGWGWPGDDSEYFKQMTAHKF